MIYHKKGGAAVEKKCLKCGREVPEDQTFCKTCLAEMEKYPVKPGVVVLLPHRESQSQKPIVRRRHSLLPLEDQVKLWKRRAIALAAALTISLSAAGVLGWLVVKDILEEEIPLVLPGQNYSSGTPSEVNSAE